MAIFDFSSPVSDNGYRWWYIDANSDSGEHAITIIVFVGSVFSPYYAWSRKKGPTKAENHCSMNVALYGPQARWCMTERAANSIVRTNSTYRIGPSQISIQGNQLVCDINEVCAPLPKRVVGNVRLNMDFQNSVPNKLDSLGKHYWQAIAPNTAINVEFEKPGVSWSGNAYVDCNYGHEPMESAFQSWNWSRSHLNNGDTLIQYDVKQRCGITDRRTLLFSENNCTQIYDLNNVTELPKTRYWRVPRSTRIAPDANVDNFRTLEDTPFYSRNHYNTTIFGQKAICMHESIDFDRFKSPWVQCLLPFRMPRISSASNFSQLQQF